MNMTLDAPTRMNRNNDQAHPPVVSAPSLSSFCSPPGGESLSSERGRMGLARRLIGVFIDDRAPGRYRTVVLRPSQEEGHTRSQPSRGSHTHTHSPATCSPGF
jgi:hypothetical protein